MTEVFDRTLFDANVFDVDRGWLVQQPPVSIWTNVSPEEFTWTIQEPA